MVWRSLYTGYDMEDAMILNKSAVERGLAHGTLFKCEAVDLREDKGKSQVLSLCLLLSLYVPCMHHPQSC